MTIQTYRESYEVKSSSEAAELRVCGAEDAAYHWLVKDVLQGTCGWVSIVDDDGTVIRKMRRRRTRTHYFDAKCQCQHCQNKAELLDMARRGEPRPR